MVFFLKNNKGKAKKIIIGIIPTEMFKYLGRNLSQTSDKRSFIGFFTSLGLHPRINKFRNLLRGNEILHDNTVSNC